MTTRTIENPARKPQKRALETREKLLEAALELFSELGFEGARTRDIEAAAGVNRGLIAYHFGSKSDLWKAAVDSLFGRVADEFAPTLSVLNELDPLTRARQLTRQFVRMSAAHPEIHRIMVQEGKHRSWRMEWLANKHVRPYFEGTKAMHQAARDTGQLPEMDHVHFYYIMVGAAALISAVTPECEIVAGCDARSSEVVEKHADALVALLYGPEQTQQGGVRQ